MQECRLTRQVQRLDKFKGSMSFERTSRVHAARAALIIQVKLSSKKSQSANGGQNAQIHDDVQPRRLNRFDCMVSLKRNPRLPIR